MPMNYVAVIDVQKCVDCRCCVVSCKDEFALNDYPPYSAGTPFRGQKWIHVENLERGSFPKVKFESYPVLCMQCDNPPCITAAKDGAVYKRPDGIVIIDPVKAKGQKQIVNACPYGVVFWNEDAQIPQKCTFCAHRLDQGETPRCMLACPGNAITIAPYPQVQKTIEENKAVPFHPEYGTQSRVYYVGLPKTFITGALVNSDGKCLAGVNVSAKDTATGKVIVSAISDAFGDFWLDGLDAKNTYQVVISTADKSKTISVSLEKDTDLGDIQLS
jgi:Fe-S-cluster-containing dehydrogenase component